MIVNRNFELEHMLYSISTKEYFSEKDNKYVLLVYGYYNISCIVNKLKNHYNDFKVCKISDLGYLLIKDNIQIYTVKAEHFIPNNFRGVTIVDWVKVNEDNCIAKLSTLVGINEHLRTGV